MQQSLIPFDSVFGIDMATSRSISLLRWSLAGALVLGDFKTNTKQADIHERGEVEAVHHVRDILLKDDEFYGTYLYINFLHM